MSSLFIPRILPLPSSLIPAAPAMAAAGDGPGIGDWESSLPSPEELTPLSQSLIPPELASAFKIGPSSAAASSLLPYMEALAFHSSSAIDRPSPSPEHEKSVDDQIDSGKSRLSADRQSNRAVAGEIGPEEELKGRNNPSQPMLLTSEACNKRVSNSAMEKVFTEGLSSMDATPISPSPFPYNPRERLVTGMSLSGEISSEYINRDLGMSAVRSHSSGGAGSRSGSGGDILSMQGDATDLDSSSINVLEESPSSCKEDLQVQAQAGSSARTLKKPRLVWTPQLHKRFVDAVAHLGIKNAVPKTIMQLMNVQGLTRENVASHLQKYRLYLKRMHGLSNGESMGAAGGPFSPESHLFASTPVPPSLANPTHFLLNSNINSSISFADSSPPVSASSLAPLLPGNHSSNPSLPPCLHIMNPPSFPAPGFGFDPRSYGAPSSSLATAANSLHRSLDHAVHQSTAPVSAADDGRVLTLFPTNMK